MKLEHNCNFKYDNLTKFTPIILIFMTLLPMKLKMTIELKVKFNHKSQYFGVTSLLNETVLLFPIKIPPLSPHWTTFQQG